VPKCAKAPVWGYTGAAIIKSSTFLRSRQFCGIYKEIFPSIKQTGEIARDTRALRKDVKESRLKSR